jgi:hypothetical protein
MRAGFLAIPCFLAVAASAAVAQGPERAGNPGSSEGDSRLPIVAIDGHIRSAVDRLARQSTLWREALDRVAALDRQVLIVTPDRVLVRDASSGSLDSFDDSTLAEVSPVVGENGVVEAVMVVLNVALLDSLHTRLGSPAREFEADLERVLAHEVYGHAVPYLLAGSIAGRCGDPGPGEPATEACSIRRENAVREQAGLGRRTDYELNSLALGRRLAVR